MLEDTSCSKKELAPEEWDLQNASQGANKILKTKQNYFTARWLLQQQILWDSIYISEGGSEKSFLQSICYSFQAKGTKNGGWNNLPDFSNWLGWSVFSSVHALFYCAETWTASVVDKWLEIFGKLLDSLSFELPPYLVAK